MMSNSPSNPIIYKILKNYLLKDIALNETAYDYDNCIYFISRKEDSDIIKFCFSCNCTKTILANGGEDMLQDLYKEYIIPTTEHITEFDLTLGIDVSKLPKTQKVKKTMDEDTQAKIKAQNEEIRKEREKVADQICMKFSCFKRDFIGAPIRRALLALKNGGGKQSDSCEIPYRTDEKYWVIASKPEVTVSFALNFDNVTDKALARIFLLEFSDSKRYVKNPPSIIYHDTKFPENIAAQFPDSVKTKYSNGVISFTLFPGHLNPTPEQPLTYLTGFRQYMHYHFHAIKASLHTRMRKRVETFQRVLTKAKREQDAPKKYKDTIGGQQVEDIKEEKKVEEVFTFAGEKN